MIDIFKLTKFKILIALALMGCGSFWGITTFGMFEGSAREGALDTWTRFERSVVRPITVGLFYNSHNYLKSLHNYSDLLIVIPIALHTLYYYFLSCLFIMIGRKSKTYLQKQSTRMEK